jgi:hypothetical protein
LSDREGNDDVLTDEDLVDQITEEGECVFEHSWDGGASPAANGSMQVYRWRGQFAYASTDYGSGGPYGSWGEVLQEKGEELFAVTSATDSIWCSLMTAEEIAARLTYYGGGDDEHFPFSVNGESWGYNTETGKFEPRPDEDGEQEE